MLLRGSSAPLKSTAVLLIYASSISSSHSIESNAASKKRKSILIKKGGWDIPRLTSLFEGEERTVGLFHSFVCSLFSRHVT